MTQSPLEIIEVICPEFLTTSGYGYYVELAEVNTSEGYFGEQYEAAVALRACHYWELNSKSRGQNGTVTYLMEGRLAKSFGGIGVIKRDLERTSWGRQLLDMIDTCNIAASTTNYGALARYL